MSETGENGVKSRKEQAGAVQRASKKAVAANVSETSHWTVDATHETKPIQKFQ